MYFLGKDLGSSSIKFSVYADKSKVIASGNAPDFEMAMHADRFGWAEQNPVDWWNYVRQGISYLI